MNNIDQKIVALQKQVVEKYNVSKIPHYHIYTEANPGYTMDKLVDMLEQKGHDAIMFLDIDCLPLENNALNYFFERAYMGKIIGDAQRSNHIQNDYLSTESDCEKPKKGTGKKRHEKYLKDNRLVDIDEMIDTRAKLNAFIQRILIHKDLLLKIRDQRNYKIFEMSRLIFAKERLYE